MSFDEMREYLLANPDVWMPSSTRKIGAGKMQASMGRRKVEDDFKETIEERLGQFQDRINAKKFPLVLEVAETVLPKLIFKRYQAFYEMAARNGITVGNTAPPFGNLAAYVYQSVQLHIPTIKKYTPDYEDFAETLNHEIIHGLISYGLRDKYQLFEDLQGVMENVEGNFDKANDEVKQIINYIQRVRGEYEVEDFTATDEDRYIGDLEELITYAFTNTEFAKFLDSIPASKDIKASGKTIFDQLKDIIRTFIQSLAKGPTALDEVNEVLNKYFDTSFREEDFIESNEKYGWGYKFEATKDRLQFSEGGRGEGPKATDPNVRKAIIKAGQMFRESGNDKRAAISAGVDELVKAGYSKKDATDIITPVIERIMQPTAAGSSTSPAGWIAMKYIPQEVRNKIDVATTTVENMKALGEMAVKNGEVNPENLAQEFANGFSRPLSPVEVSAMVYYKAQLHNKITEAYKALEDAKRRNNASQIETEEANVAKLEQQLQNYYIASRKSAYEMGLAFRLRQMLLDQDYELIEVETKYRAKYGPIPAETKATFEELEKQRKELLEKEKQLELDREAFEREKTMAGLVQQVEQKKKGNDTGAKSDQS